MKKKLPIPAVLCLMGFLNAQVRIVNSNVNSSVTNSPAFIDASSNTSVNAANNIGKGIIFPRVDLSAMTSFPAVTAGIPNSFPTRFDGMIVYNTATSGTAGIGTTSGTLTAGFWYYENKSSTNNGGTWKPITTSAGSGGDNLGDHSATQNLVMNDNAIRLRAFNDPNHGVVYSSTLGGPRLWGDTGGALGTINGTNALTWDNSGKVISPLSIKAVQSGNGGASVDRGGSNTSGLLQIFKPNGSRLGFIGNSITEMQYYSESGGHRFNTSVKTGDTGIGSIILNEGGANSGFLQILKADGTRVGLIGNSNTDMQYYSDSGIHRFNNTIKAGNAGIGSITLNAGDAQPGYMQIFKADGTRVGLIGNSPSDMQYFAESGIHRFNTSLKVGNINLGSITLNDGGANPGLLQIFKADGNRVGLIGNSNTDMQYYADSGIHRFNTSLKVGNTNLGSITLNDGGANPGLLQIFKADGNRVGLIGNSNTDMQYYSDSGIHRFNTSLKVGNNNLGSITLSDGGANPGLLQIFKADGSRVGFIGNSTDMQYYADSAIHRFNGTIITPRVQGPSDRRFKKDITPIYNATEKLNQLNGYTYTWRDKKEFPGQALGEGKDMGVIAQEVEKVFPDAVMTNKEGYKSVNYNALIPVLIQALKESNERIKALEEKQGMPIERTEHPQPYKGRLPATKN